jgi:multidrug efflux pump subunit AcrB
MQEETSREVAFTYAIALAVIYALFPTGTSINIYSQIGLVLLIRLMAKNSVLLVELADQLRDGGYGIREAIDSGATIRLRPPAPKNRCGLPMNCNMQRELRTR